MGGGAMIGASIDFSVQMAVNMTINGNTAREAFSNVDWTSVGSSAVTGALGAPGLGLANSIKLSGMVASSIADASFDVTTAKGTESLFNGEKSGSEALIDVGGSLLGDVVSGGLVAGAKSAIKNDITSNGFKTLDKADQTLLRETQTVVNSQGFESGVNTGVELGTQLLQEGTQSVFTTPELIAPSTQSMTLPSDNTIVNRTILKID